MSDTKKKTKNSEWGARSKIIDTALLRKEVPANIAAKVLRAFPKLDLKETKHYVYRRAHELRKHGRKVVFLKAA